MTTDIARLASLAETFRNLHRGAGPLVLANAWDAATARAAAEAGFPAIATTSSGIAASLGWSDGEQIPPDEAFRAIARIARVIDLPLTADIEAGYGLPAGELASGLIGAGAVGCNLEDTDHRGSRDLVDPAEQAERIASLKRAARVLGVDLVINARIDVFLRSAGAEATGERVLEAIRRGRAYLDAGADCAYPIFARGESLIASLVNGIGGPVNILAMAGGPSLARLGALGVARISLGARLQQLAMADHRGRLLALRRGDDV